MEKLLRTIFAGAIAFSKRQSLFWTSKLENTNGTLTLQWDSLFLIGYKNIDVNVITLYQQTKEQKTLLLPQRNKENIILFKDLANLAEK